MVKLLMTAGTILILGGFTAMMTSWPEAATYTREAKAIGEKLEQAQRIVAIVYFVSGLFSGLLFLALAEITSQVRALRRALAPKEKVQEGS